MSGRTWCASTWAHLRLDAPVEFPAEQWYDESGKKMPVTIPDDVLAAAHMSEADLRRELAVTLFQQDRLTLAQASRIAEMSQLAFQAFLAERRIPIHYGVEEFHEDLRTIRRTERP